MARINIVELKGTIIPLKTNSAGVTRPNPSFKEDPDGSVTATIVIQTVHDLHKAGSPEASVKSETLSVSTKDEMLVEYAKTLKAFDIIEVDGVLVTKDIWHRFTCECGHVNYIKTTTSYVHPEARYGIHKIGEAADLRDSTKQLLAHRLRSNAVLLTGNCCAEHFNDISASKGEIANYQLKVRRPYIIEEDKTKGKYDYPWIKTYGKIAKNDKFAINKSGDGEPGTTVFVIGTLRCRNFPQTFVCGKNDEAYKEYAGRVAPDMLIDFGSASGCGKETRIDSSAMEVIAYSTEYLQNYNRFPTVTGEPEEIDEILQPIVDVSENIQKEMTAEEARERLAALNKQLFGE